MSQHKPYAPTTWGLGGATVSHVDTPITAVFLVLFIISAATHMTIFQLNNRRSHKFLLSGLLFGFSMARIATTTLRLVSIHFSHDVPLAIAAQIFVAAGVVIIYIVNLLFVQRLLRATHPHLGWGKIMGLVFKCLYALVILTITMVIVVTVQSFYTLNPNTRRIDRDIQLYGATTFAVIAFLPLPLLSLVYILPRRVAIDKFGAGRFHTKIIILAISSILICFGAAYRAGTSYLTPVPRSQPLPKYFHKAAFYIVNFGVEIIVLYMYAIFRVDLRFHVPDGVRGPGSYSAEGERRNVSEDVRSEEGTVGSEGKSFKDEGRGMLSEDIERNDRGFLERPDAAVVRDEQV